MAKVVLIDRATVALLLKHKIIEVDQRHKIQVPIQDTLDKEIRSFLQEGYGFDPELKLNTVVKARKRFAEEDLERRKACMAAGDAACDLLEEKEKEAQKEKSSGRVFLEEGRCSLQILDCIPDHILEQLLSTERTV